MSADERWAVSFDEQAEPLDTNIPFDERKCSMVSDLIPGRVDYMRDFCIGHRDRDFPKRVAESI